MNVLIVRLGALGDVVHAIPAAVAVSTFRSSYALILLDPPYHDPSLPALLESLGRSAILAEDTLVILEHARSTEIPHRVGRLQLSRTRHHGTTAITLFEGGMPAAGPAA